ncbi:MAG: hypothetical protein KI786_08360 [Mameliella sp.]|nr:hypothetical protein [Phaeodactylibacter sp.]
MTELNRNTIEDAIEQLPVYAPPAACWGEISQELDRFSQGSNLRSSIQALPEYAPPASNWQQIAATLDQDRQEAPLKEAIQSLPEYSPPERVWNEINRELRPNRLKPVYVVLARVAAVMALAITGWWALKGDYSAPTETTYAYAEETVERSFEAVADWEDANQAMQFAVQEFKQDPVAQQLPAYSLLLSEWDELQSAKAEIKDMMDRYGADAQLIRQMSKIEKDRSGLVREMIAQI